MSIFKPVGTQNWPKYSVVCKHYLFFAFFFQLKSLNPFGLGDSPALFNENLKTFLTSLDKVGAVFHAV